MMSTQTTLSSYHVSIDTYKIKLGQFFTTKAETLSYNSNSSPDHDLNQVLIAEAAKEKYDE